jgi:hypothetical protein
VWKRWGRILFLSISMNASEQIAYTKSSRPQVQARARKWFEVLFYPEANIFYGMIFAMLLVHHLRSP